MRLGALEIGMVYPAPPLTQRPRIRSRLFPGPSRERRLSRDSMIGQRLRFSA